MQELNATKHLIDWVACDVLAPKFWIQPWILPKMSFGHFKEMSENRNAFYWQNGKYILNASSATISIFHFPENQSHECKSKA